MTALRIVVLFVLAAIAEIGGAWLIWQTMRDSKPWWFAGLGVLALAGYGLAGYQAVALRADRRDGLGLSEAFGVADGTILASAVGVKPNSA